jgi:hypothetical protein
MGGALTIDKRAPVTDEKWLPEYKGEGPWFTADKKTEKNIVFSPEGPGSADEKTGTPAQTLCQIFDKAVENHGDKVIL